MIKSIFEEEIFFNTVLIQNVTSQELGTGFLIQKPVDKNFKRVLLFSNKHVFWGRKDQDNPNAEKKIILTLHKKETDGSYNLGSIVNIELNISRKQKDYFEHPDPKIDVACLNISNVFNENKIENRIIEIEEFTNFEMDNLTVGQKIFFVGYPQGYFDAKHFLPIVRSGTIASIPNIDFNGEKQILIDAPVFPGSSGSPVFFLHSDSKYKLLGIISSAPYTNLDYIETSVKKEEEEKIPIKFFGLGLLFKLETLKTVIDQVI